jgi:hypothetical protein
MPSAVSPSSLRQDGSYWSTRQWIYELPSIASPARPAPEENRYAADRSGRPLTADDRHPEPVDSVADPRVVGLFAELKFNLPHQLGYRNVTHPVRPIVAKLLKWLSTADGRPVPLEQVCRQLWGRPIAPSYSTFHVTIYKANLALKNVECPLLLVSRLNRLVMVLK